MQVGAPVPQQPDYVNAELRRLPVLLHRTREAFSAHFRSVFLENDLTDPQWRILQLIQKHPEMDISELSRRSFLLGPSLSRILRDLTERGLIERHPDPKDARRAFHSLTAAGQAQIDKVLPCFDPIYADLDGRLDRDQVRELNARLESLLAVLRPDSVD